MLNKASSLYRFFQATALLTILSLDGVATAYGQSADSDASAVAGAASGDGSSSADSGSTATASAGQDGSGGITADAEAQTRGSAMGGDTSVVNLGISAEASASSGDIATAQTSSSAGTSAGATAGNYKSVYAEGGTMLTRQGPNRGYAIAYQDGAYSAAYYRGDTASAVSGVYTGQTLTNKDARSIIRSSAKAGATAHRARSTCQRSSDVSTPASVCHPTSAHRVSNGRTRPRIINE